MGRDGYSGNGNRRGGNGGGNGGGRDGGGRDGGGRDSGRGGRSRGGQGGGSRGGQGGGNRGRGRGGNSRGGGGRRFGGPRHNMNSGNKRERIQVESGYLVLIDQFMLANPQFLERVETTMNEAPEIKNQIIQEFGGVVVQLEPALYRIERNPFNTTIVVHQEGELPEADTLPTIASESAGQVFVDTRCLAMIDRELLDDADLLHKYRDLWFAGEDKACRDLLRDNGGAVRYGFQRFGDELLVYGSGENNMVALWPSKQAATVEAEEAA